MHISEIPPNARKPIYACVGLLGGGSGVPDPRRFVTQGSGKGGPFDPRLPPPPAVTQPGSEPPKWTRPLAPNFEPKLGRPKVRAPPQAWAAAPAAGDDDDEGAKPKTVTFNGTAIAGRNFIAEGKKASAAAKPKDANALKPPASLPLGVMPEYIVARKNAVRAATAKAESERIVKKKIQKEIRRLEKRQLEKLIKALKARRDECEAAMFRAELGGTELRRKKLEVEISALNKDLESLETRDVIIQMKA